MWTFKNVFEIVGIIVGMAIPAVIIVKWLKIMFFGEPSNTNEDETLFKDTNTIFDDDFLNDWTSDPAFHSCRTNIWHDPWHESNWDS